MTWDQGQQLRAHAEAYGRTHDGRHPYTDAWPWAAAVVAWREQTARISWRGTSYVFPQHRDLATAGVAESLRLGMARHSLPLGDLPVDLEHELSTQLLPESPEPGSDGWPAPTGPHAQHWQALMSLLGAGDRRGRDVVHAAGDALQVLARYACTRPHLRPEARDELARRRTEGGLTVDVIRFAEIAPSLPTEAPVPVEDPSLYEPFDGVRVTVDSLTAPRLTAAPQPGGRTEGEA